MVHDDGPVGLDCVAGLDERSVADAGIVLAVTLAQRLGIEALVDDAVRLGDRSGAANARAKVMKLVILRKTGQITAWRPAALLIASGLRRRAGCRAARGRTHSVHRGGGRKSPRRQPFV